MSESTIDVSRSVLVLGITGRVPPSGDGTFVTGDFPAVVEEVGTMVGGQSVRVHRVPGGMLFTVTCGRHSECHRIMGTKWDRETAQRNARTKVVGESIRCQDPTNGDVFSAQNVVVAQPPSLAMNEEPTVTWVLHGTDVSARYGLLLPVGGGSQ